MGLGRPISPSEVAAAQQEAIPAGVFDVVNSLIAANLYGKSARVLQKEVVAALEELGHIRSAIFSNGWLNFEDSYRSLGWKVEYDKPAYNESYDAYWIFTKRR